MRLPGFGLLRASHPLPAAAVTVFGTALALAAGAGARTAALVAAAVGLGQLTIGWLNDLCDTDSDTQAGRTSKPLVSGDVSPRAVRAAVAVAAVGSVAASVALGPLPGVLNVVSVASGWAYDLGLKRTALSPLPYLVSFGLLPVVAATAAGATPAAAVAVAAAVLGAAAHFANTVPDAAVDAATGVRGLPQRLGPARSQTVAASGVVLACGVLLVAEAEDLPLVAVLLLVGASVVGALSPFVPRHAAFRVTLLAAAVAVAGVVAAG